jgi:very-short-patch-repair endonuclease
VCQEGPAIVEVDGGQHDRSSPREAGRSGSLRGEGYRILRFWNNEILENLGGVYEAIADEPGHGAPSQTVPHRGAGFLPDEHVSWQQPSLL